MIIIINYYFKFGSTLANIAKILQKYLIFLIYTHYLLGPCFFAGKKPLHVKVLHSASYGHLYMDGDN